MKPGRGAAHPEKAASRESGTREIGPTLPPWKAFVVQFSRETGSGGSVFAGRVEHLNSARRVRFGSADELIEVLTRLLDEVARG